MWMTTISYVDGVVPQGSDVRGSGTWVRAVIQLGVRNVFDGVLPTWLQSEDTERTAFGIRLKVGEGQWLGWRRWENIFEVIQLSRHHLHLSGLKLHSFIASCWPSASAIADVKNRRQFPIHRQSPIRQSQDRQPFGGARWLTTNRELTTN